MVRRLPVTLIGGFLGAGKTSLLHGFISEHQGGHLALLVENPGALNLDAKALRGLCGAMRRTYDEVHEIPPMDEEAQIAWIADRLRELAQAGRFERVLIEVAGTSNASRLAQNFGLLPGQPNSFGPWAELAQIVTVVDALDFHREVVHPARREAPGGLNEFVLVQIEGASQIVLNKCDLVDDASREACTRHLRQLNPEARIIETAYGEVPGEIWAKPDSPQHLGLAMERRLRPVTEESTSAPALGSALYRAWRPFHPGRFWDWYNAEHTGLLRIKGLIWLASRNLLVGGVSRTRWQNGCGTAGIWWAALPREEWPEDAESLAKMQELWREPYGDRRQELVLIGDEVQLAGATRRQLDACLLTEEEYAQPVKEWTTLPDPFPEWDLDGE